MKYFDKLNQRLGAAIRDNVVKDIAQGRTAGPGRVRQVTSLFAILIIITPYCVAAAGIALIGFNLDSIPAILIGLGIVAAGYYLRTPNLRNSKETLRRAEAPELFSLLDDIAKMLDAPAVNGIHVDGHYNAYVSELQNKERILEIGAPLWLALTPKERVALLSHELAHLMNRDTANSRLIYKAHGTLGRWYDLSHPPELVDQETDTRFYFDDRSLVDQFFGFLFGSAIAGVAFGFESLIFADSQRAEYLADVASADVAGADATGTLMKKIILSPIAHDILQKTYFDGSKKITLFQDMARAVQAPAPDQAAKIYAEATKETHRIDQSHPPTLNRMEVIAAAGKPTPTLEVNRFDWATITKELAPHFSREEQRVLAKILVQ